ARDRTPVAAAIRSPDREPSSLTRLWTFPRALRTILARGRFLRRSLGGFLRCVFGRARTIEHVRADEGSVSGQLPGLIVVKRSYIVDRPLVALCFPFVSVTPAFTPEPEHEINAMRRLGILQIELKQLFLHRRLQ